MAKKPKSLKIHPDDQIVGIVPRQKRDLLKGCNEPGKPWFNRDEFQFAKANCAICKNADCMRAKGAISPWHTRMAEQVDYLLNNPEFSDLTSESHRGLAQMAFDDISQKQMRLEIARQRGDWTIPEAADVPSDGIDKIAAPDTTDQFDEAVRALAEAKGNKAPDLERPEQEDKPAHFQEQDPQPEPATEAPEDEWEYDTHFPSTDGKRSYHITLSLKGEWRCECEGFKYKNECKHLGTVKSWYEDQLEQGEEQERQEAEEAKRRQQAAQQPPPPPARDPRVPNTTYNTPMPQGGVMVGGGAAPEPEPEPDPWATPKKGSDTVVQPGAVVTLKGSKKNE